MSTPPMFLLLALLLLLFLPWPLSLGAALVIGILGVVEVLYWQGRMRGRRVETGVEGLVGSVGTVAEPLAPLGQVRIHGELWEARSAEEVPAGSQVRVLAVNGLRLDVEEKSESP